MVFIPSSGGSEYRPLTLNNGMNNGIRGRQYGISDTTLVKTVHGNEFGVS